MSNPFRLKSPIGEAYNMNGEDTLNTKKALAGLGHMDIPEGGLDEYPDMSMIDAVKSFQRANDLAEDGVMKPEGPTLKRLNETLVARQEPAKRPSIAPVFMPEQSNPPGPAITPIALKHPIRASSNVDLGDTGKVKSALDALGLPLPEGAADPYPSHDLFNNIRAFQRREGLASDGEMLPGGETEARMNDLLREQAAAATAPSGQKSPADDEVQVAQAQGGRTLPPGVSAGNSALSIFQKHFAKKALEGTAGAAGAAAIGTSGALTGDAAREDNRPAGNARTDIAPSSPQLPGYEPPKAKMPDRMENIPEPVEVPDLSSPLPKTEKPTVFVLPAPEPGEFGDGIVERKGNEATRKELERIRDFYEKVRGWKHIAGGRYSDRNEKVLHADKKAGGEQGEFHVPGHFGSLKGGRFTDLTFEDENSRVIHIQTVDVDRNGKPTQKELDAAEDIRKATGHSVLLIPKGAQLERLTKRRGRQ